MASETEPRGASTRSEIARRIATRYDKAFQSYSGFVHLAAIRVWLKELVNSP
jgi:transposase